MANRSDDVNATQKKDDNVPSTSGKPAIKLFESFTATFYRDGPQIVCGGIDKPMTLIVFDDDYTLADETEKLKLVANEDVVEVSIYVFDKEKNQAEQKEAEEKEPEKQEAEEKEPEKQEAEEKEPEKQEAEKKEPENKEELLLEEEQYNEVDLEDVD
ncbi:hypothetical protein KR038_003913 [Drosophila bunnanda]|nr:hypothetical protein KR038_003913 [Drosophila bunnanda]